MGKPMEYLQANPKCMVYPFEAVKTRFFCSLYSIAHRGGMVAADISKYTEVDVMR